MTLNGMGGKILPVSQDPIFPASFSLPGSHLQVQNGAGNSTKTCSCCGKEKHLDQFGPDKRRASGASSRCMDIMLTVHDVAVFSIAIPRKPGVAWVSVEKSEAFRNICDMIQALVDQEVAKVKP